MMSFWERATYAASAYDARLRNLSYLHGPGKKSAVVWDTIPFDLDDTDEDDLFEALPKVTLRMVMHATLVLENLTAAFERRLEALYKQIEQDSWEDIINPK